MRMNMRNTPLLTFISDSTVEYGVDMIHKIDEIVADDEARHVDDGEEEE